MCVCVCVFSCVSSVVCVELLFTAVGLGVRTSIISTVHSRFIARLNVTEKFCVLNMPAVFVAR